MSSVVFVGPTLEVGEARSILDAKYLPPVSQGDVYRVVQDKPVAIGIIDGYFERVPAVWHKEILWAMAQGVHVFGTASMGALRAAELAPFGMIGVGATFEAFRDGQLEDDDEVTIAHAPAMGGYRPLSEAMVNIRATLARAESEEVIGSSTRRGLETLAKGLHYTQRDYPRVTDLARERGLDRAELTALEAWLPQGRRDQKRSDAVAMLEAMKTMLERDPGPKRVGFHFQRTDAWEQVARRSGRQVAAARPDQLPSDVLLDELRLVEGAFGTVMEHSLARALALNEAQRRAPSLDKDHFHETFNRFFVERGCKKPEQIRLWMADQELDEPSLTLLLSEEMRLHWIRRLFAPEAMEQLEDQLRVSGRYARVLGRARRKREFLSSQGLENPSLNAAGRSEDELLHWFFVRRRAGEVPKDLDLYAQSQGFANRLSLLQALLREYYFVTGTEGEADSPAPD